MSHPLIELHFWFTDPIVAPEIVTRHWYHVPRIGDTIELVAVLAEGATTLTGDVKQVIWSDDFVKVVL